MKKDLIDTIMEKEFHELSAAEREEIQSFCATEEDFNQAREVFLGVEALNFETPMPKAETKERLDHLFHQTYPKVAPVWYMSIAAVIVPKEKAIFRQPLVQIAAIGLLFLLVYPLWTSENALKATPQQTVSEVEPVETKPLTASNITPAPKEVKSVPNSNEPLAVDKLDNFPSVTHSEPIQMDVSTTRTSTASNHPDGVYVAYSQPASEAPEMLDLLTTTF